MRLALAILLLPLFASAQTDTTCTCPLPMTGGHQIVIFPDGAYVPNSYIDQATDSVGTWRKGDEENKVRKASAIGQAQRIMNLELANDSMAGQMLVDSTAMAEVLQQYATEVEALTTDRDDWKGKAQRRGLWAVVGKVFTVATLTVVVFVGYMIIRDGFNTTAE